MVDIDKGKVRRSFGSQALNYDDLAMVQQKVVDRFLELNMTGVSPPETVLDVGCGTGRLLESILSRVPSACAVGVDLAHGMLQCASARLGESVSLVCGDGETLPFKDASFDLVVSTSVYQWINPADRAFAEARRVLKPGGRFCFALFGENTLMELRRAYKLALSGKGSGETDRSHNFASREQTLSALSSAGFRECSVVREFEVEMHADVPALLRSLKGIGAGNASAAPSRGLSGRSVTTAMMDIYERNHAGENGIPATYEVLYGVGLD